MNLEKEIQRIIAGIIRCKFSDGKIFILKTPSRYHRYIAEEIYSEVYNEAIESEMMNEQELIDFMLDANIWSIEEEDLISSLPKSIDDLKAQMYENAHRTNEVDVCRGILKKAKADLNRLIVKKGSLQHTCAEGYANIEKNKYLISHSLFYINGEPLVGELGDYSLIPSFLIEEAIFLYKENRLGEEQIREIAKSNQWRYQWSLKGVENIFGIPVVDLSEEQKTLISWSALYDNIYQNPECPNENIIKDDDLLDGWMIVQRRKQLLEKEVGDNDRIINNEKISEAQEIFIVPGSKKFAHLDIEKIGKLNTKDAEMTKRQRLGFLRKKGVVAEAEMPDSKRDIIRQFMAKQKVGN